MLLRKATLVIVLLALVFPAVLKLYYVRNDGSGEVFWNESDVYIFERLSQRGYPTTYYGYLIEFVRELFPFGASAPRDNHYSVAILRITSDSIRRFKTDDFWLSEIEPFEGALYGGNMLPGGSLMKWSGREFQLPSNEDLQRYHANSASLPWGPSYENREGWSKRTAAGKVLQHSPTDYGETDERVEVRSQGNTFTLVMNSGFISQEAYIDLLRPGHPPQRIWYLDERPHRVSKSEYKAIFGAY